MKNQKIQQTNSSSQFRQLNDILNQFMPEEKKPIEEKEEIKMDDDIQWAFKNWKNSRSFK